MNSLCLAKNDLCNMLSQFKARAKALRREVVAVYLDDLLIVPSGIWLAIRLIPSEGMKEARATAATDG